MPLIYKICPRALWREAEAAGRFTGAPVDHQDGGAIVVQNRHSWRRTVSELFQNLI